MKSKETLFEVLDWSLFSFGGVVAAFLLPSSVVITLWLQKPIPVGLLNVLQPLPIAKLYLLVLLGGSAWHAMHRVRFVLYGLGLAEYRRPVAVVTTSVLGLIIIWILLTLFAPELEGLLSFFPFR